MLGKIIVNNKILLILPLKGRNEKKRRNEE